MKLRNKTMDNKSCFLLILQLFVFILNADAQWQTPADSSDSCTRPEPGRCIPIKECAPIVELLEKSPKPLSSAVTQKLRSYTCGFSGNMPKVCCPSRSLINGGSGNGGSNDNSDISKHPNFRLLSTDCGRTGSEYKIVYGEEADLNEFPWMALLSYRGNSGPSFQCGGSIITEKYILTAAHCVKNTVYPLIGVRVGEHDTRNQTDCEYDAFGKTARCMPPVQDVRIKRVKAHPGYSREKLINDIALIEVTPSIDLSKENTRPVCLPVGNFKNPNLVESLIQVAGWGATETGRKSEILQKVSLRIIPLTRCKQIYKDNKLDLVSDKIMCAKGEGGRDSCAGDSGGPLQKNEHHYNDNRFIQFGVVSFGPKFCGVGSLSGVYTDVSKYMDWILDNID